MPHPAEATGEPGGTVRHRPDRTEFSDEERVGKLASFFAVLAVFISCLGIFGLASFVAEQRTKEIGVRKSELGDGRLKLGVRSLVFGSNAFGFIPILTGRKNSR